MPESELTSCIMIFFNEEKFIEEAIVSVLNQSIKNWELILVDDGSSDRSSEIAKEYCSKYPDKIFLYEHSGHRNRGMSASRNLGIQKSQGEFIAFLDADDIWMPRKLEKQIDILRQYPEAAMVYGRSLMWYNWPGSDQPDGIDEFPELGVEPDNLIYPPHLFNLLLKNQYQSPTTCSAMIRRKVFDSIGYFKEDFKGMFEDQVLFAKVNLHYPVYVSNEYWAKYRQHKDSCSSRNSKENYYKLRAPFINWLDEYLNINGFENLPPYWKTLKLQSRFAGFFTFYNFVRKHIRRMKVLNNV